MREAMARAEVGDDVHGDDPTVKALERRTAAILGKEAAIYMPSGTMTNQVALRCHTEPGDEMLIEAQAHCYYYEAGAPAALAGLTCRLIPGQRGIFTVDDFRRVLRMRDIHFPVPKLLCVENTHNRGGGSVWPIELLIEVTDAAKEDGLKRHLDGARLWNAAIAELADESRIASSFDSVSVCFSKGLGAPVGSALAGSAEFVERARRFRKMFGGGMRQAGIIAAGALYALEHHRERLADDHCHAKLLADALAELPDLRVAPEAVETNIVAFETVSRSAAELVEGLRRAGVALLATGSNTIRAVTHLDVSKGDIESAIGIFRSVVRAS